MTGDIRTLSAIGGVLVRRPIKTPDPDPVVPGVPEDIDPAIYRTTLTWKANYLADTAALVASYEGPDQDIKMATPGTTMTLVADPITPGATRKFMKAVQPNGTATTNGVTSSPRFQIEDPRRVVEGDAFWTAQTYIFPADWPAVGLFQGFLQVYQFFGAPFGGGPTISLTCRSDGQYDDPDTLRWGFNRDNGNIATGLAWKWPMQRMIYVDIAMRIVAGRKDPRTDDVAGIFFPAKGSVEIWMNTGQGWVQQTLLGGVTRIACAVIGEVNDVGPNSNEIQIYRRLDEFFDPVTLYVGGHARGPSLASVDPKSYSQPKPPVPTFVVGTTKPSSSNCGAGSLVEADGVTVRSAPTVVFNGNKSLTGGQTLKNLIINGRVTITGANNTVENCIIRGASAEPTAYAYLVESSNSTGTLIRHCDLRPQTSSPYWNAVGRRNYTVERCDISRITDGFSIFNLNLDRRCNVKVRANYGHDMVQYRPDYANNNREETHNDWAQLESNAQDVSDVEIEGNYFNARFEYARNASGAPITPTNTNRSCIMLSPVSNGTTGHSVSVSAINNWLDGGYITINGGGNNPGSRVYIIGNRFERPTETTTSGGTGVTKSLILDTTITIVAVSNNVYSDNGGAVPISGG